MTALTMYRPRTEQPVRCDCGVQPRAAWGDLAKVASAALRPLVVAVGVIIAGAVSLAPAHADPPTDPITAALNGAGIANNGSASTAIAGIGRSICPMLVKPGATFASIASQLAGNTGLSPGMAGLVAGMAIQMECPGMMTSLANGNMPFPMQALGGPAAGNPFGLPAR